METAITPPARVVLTGAAGRLGRMLLPRLAKSYEVTALDIAPVEGHPISRIVDVTDLAGLREAMAGHDAVVHLAGASTPRFEPFEDIYRLNAYGTWCVLQAAKENGIRQFVYCSSDYVSGVSGNAPCAPDYLPIDEVHPTRPMEPYGASKEAAEGLCRLAARAWGAAVTILRPTLIRFPEVSETARARANDPGNPDVWCYIEPEDVTRAFEWALMVGTPGCRTYFVSAARTLASVPTLELVRQRFGMLPKIRRPRLYQRDPYASIFDCSKIYRDFPIDLSPKQRT